MRKTIAIILNTLASVALILCALRYVVTLWPLLLLNSMQTHVTLLVAFGLALCLLVTGSRVSAVLLVIALALAGHSLVMKREFAIEPTEADRASGRALRLVSFNMLAENLTGAKDVADMLAASDADVAIILEGAPLFMQLQRIAATFPYRIGCGQGTPTCDLLLFSRLPLEDISIGDLSDLRMHRVMSARVRLAGGPVRVVAAHLSKPFFDEYHIKELKRLKAFLANTTEPVVLAGDFNSATIAPDMQDMVRQLSLRTVLNEPATWPVELAETGLGVPIDHIFSRPPLVPLSVRRLDRDYGSNHFGLVADFALRKS